MQPVAWLQPVRWNWHGRLAVATLALTVAGFAVLGLSRLVVGVDTARLLAAPLLFGGFLAAVATFCVALVRSVRHFV